MQLLISPSSKVPIYEQIADQIRTMIRRQDLPGGTLLPSVRSVAKDVHISALTVKKAYDRLEEEGYVSTVHGKGTYVNTVSASMVEEEVRAQVEAALAAAIDKAKSCGWSHEQIVEAVQLLLEEES